MFKFLVWHVLLVTVSCELFNQQLGYSVEYAPTYDNYKPRDYHFDYAVSDPHTGDHKSQWEVKQNGVVRGAYSLLEPDGTTRIVEYIADHDGFRAVVKKLGVAVHPTPVHQVPLVVPEVAHHSAYDGQVSNYANLEVQQPILYNIEQNLGPKVITNVVPEQQGPLKTLENYVGQVVDANIGRIQAVPLPIRQIEAVPVQAGHGIEVPLNFGKLEVPQSYAGIVPQTYGRIEVPQSYAGGQIEVPQSYAGAVPQSYGRIEVPQSYAGPVPQSYGRIEVPQSYAGPVSQSYGRIEVPQGDVGPVPQSYGRIEVPQGDVGSVPQSYGRIEVPQGDVGSVPQSYGRIEVPQSYAKLVPQSYGIGYGLGGGAYNLQVDLGGAGDGLARLEAVPQSPVSDGQNLQRTADNHLRRVEEVPELVAISPSYSTNVQYHGLTGNPEDDSAYTKDDYHGSSSRRVPKVVPAPFAKGHSDVKGEKPLKEQFLIYYPDAESH